MQLGISLASSSTLAPREAAAHLLDRARAANRAGLDSLSLGDSHNQSGAGYLQNTPALGRVLAEWDDRPAGCLFLVPLWNPLLIAEQVATLAALHEGRFILQTGLGGDAAQFAAMGAQRQGRASTLEEGIRIVRALLDGETVSSERFAISDAAIALRPPESVDWWMGTMSEVGVRRAARMGAAFYAGPQGGGDDLVRLTDIYRSAAERSNTEPRVMVRRDVIVLADAERAHELADRTVDQGYRGMRRDQVLAGDPEQVAGQLADLDDLGVDQVVARTMGISPDVDLETIDSLGAVRGLL
jgi:alkanesulfonate monooxygenase SsuD/methylene tetrahydromethanopterin reductase-like flavin-dependent oxidoreductase (luciferase family)